MVKHIVFWTFRENAEGRSRRENITEAQKRLLSLKDKIKEVVSLEVGVNFNPGEGAYDLALYSKFQSPKDLDAYQKHPEHQKVADFISKVRTSRAVVDYLSE
jgi:hypothetical protein